MDSVVVFMTQTPTHDELHQCLAEIGSLNTHQNDYHCVLTSHENTNHHIFIDEGGPELLDDFTPQELHTLERLNIGHDSIVISYRNTDFLTTVLKRIAACWQVAIYDDYGNFIHGEKFTHFAPLALQDILRLFYDTSGHIQRLAKRSGRTINEILGLPDTPRGVYTPEAKHASGSRHSSRES